MNDFSKRISYVVTFTFAEFPDAFTNNMFYHIDLVALCANNIRYNFS